MGVSALRLHTRENCATDYGKDLRRNSREEDTQYNKPHQQEDYRVVAFLLSFHFSGSVTLPSKYETLCRQSLQNSCRGASPSIYNPRFLRVSISDSEYGGGEYTCVPLQTGHVCIGTNAVTSPAIATRSTPPTRKVIPRPEGRESGIKDSQRITRCSTRVQKEMNPILPLPSQALQSCPPFRPWPIPPQYGHVQIGA
jgi:hypothetical protein